MGLLALAGVGQVVYATSATGEVALDHFLHLAVALVVLQLVVACWVGRLAEVARTQVLFRLWAGCTGVLLMLAVVGTLDDYLAIVLALIARGHSLGAALSIVTTHIGDLLLEELALYMTIASVACAIGWFFTRWPIHELTQQAHEPILTQLD
jgi:hypothetical protein